MKSSQTPKSSHQSKSSQTSRLSKPNKSSEPQTFSEVIDYLFTYETERRAAGRRIKERKQHLGASFAGFFCLEFAIFFGILGVLLLRLPADSPLPSLNSLFNFIVNNPQTPGQFTTLSSDHATILCSIQFGLSLILLLISIPALIKGLRHLGQIITQASESDQEIITYHVKKKLWGHIALIIILIGALLYTIFH